MSAPTHRVREEFDRIALLTESHGGGAGDVYYDYLVRCLPPRPEKVLEIGCGAGAFTRLLAPRARVASRPSIFPRR
jgi:ubiquinone/menaquinone biosynthesis C-methylase UbiE